MTERVAEYQRLVEKIMAPDTPESPKLSDDESNAAFERLDVLWSAMAQDEREAIEAWRKERQ